MQHRNEVHRSSRAPRGRQAGSAYVIALLALIVLTILGMAVALITQNELQVGGNERVANRVFYSSDSGVAVATARALVAGDYLPNGRTIKIPDSVTGSPLTQTNQLAMSPFFPVQDQPCDLCGINSAGEYGAKNFANVTYVETSTAKRVDSNATEVASKMISAMVGVQPWQPGIASYFATVDPTQVDKIKF